MAAADEWEVRGAVNADGRGIRRAKGFGKVGAHLETRDAMVLVSLTADGVLTLRIALPGDGQGSLMVMGRIARDLEGKLLFRPSHPNLGFGVEVTR